MKYLIYQQAGRGLGRISRAVKFVNIIKHLDHSHDTIILCSDPIIHEFPLPSGTEIASLPAMSKLAGGSYRSDKLSLPLEDLLSLRSEVILGYAKGFAPHYLVMDTIPGGARGELESTLLWMRQHLPASKVVYISRDIVGPADEIVPIWTNRGVYALLETFVDHILVFGEKEIFDWAVEYRLPSKARDLLSYCGYFEHQVFAHHRQADTRGRRRLLVTVGGGVDGGTIVRAALLAFRESSRALSVTVVLGPQMAEEERLSFTALGNGLKGVEVMTFTPSFAQLVQRSDVVVSMAGFNTVNEILAAGARAVLIPRKLPSTEQFERARRLQRLGLVSVIDPDELSPERLRTEVQALLDTTSACRPGTLQFDTKSRVARALKLWE